VETYWHKFGPVAIRTGWMPNTVRWGQPRVRIGGLTLWSRSNSGAFIPASYHPNWSATWRWTIWISKDRHHRGWLWYKPRWREVDISFFGYTCEFRWQDTVRVQSVAPPAGPTPNAGGLN
jgi:hypothetical protein